MRVRVPLVVSFVSIFVFIGNVAAQDLRSKVSMVYSSTPIPQITITNNHSRRLTGMVITVSSVVASHTRGEVIWLDSGVNFKHDRPLESGESRSFHVTLGRQDPTAEPQLMAVSFDDFTSGGDDQWVAKLHARRRAAYDEIGVVTSLLNQALAKNEPNEQIISTLNDMHKSLRTSISLVEARSAAGLVINTAVSNLERGGVGGSIGDPQKTIPVVLLPMFNEWREALKHYDRNIG